MAALAPPPSVYTWGTGANYSYASWPTDTFSTSNTTAALWYVALPALSPGDKAHLALARVGRPLPPGPRKPSLAIRPQYTLAPRTVSHARRRRRRWATRR